MSEYLAIAAAFAVDGEGWHSKEAENLSAVGCQCRTRQPALGPNGSQPAVHIFAYCSSTVACMTSDGNKHRVYLSFMLNQGWLCQFLKPDLKTSLPRTFTFASEDRLRGLVERAGGRADFESRNMLERAIGLGRDGVYLSLTLEQYARLKVGRTRQGCLSAMQNQNAIGCKAINDQGFDRNRRFPDWCFVLTSHGRKTSIGSL